MAAVRTSTRRASSRREASTRARQSRSASTGSAGRPPVPEASVAASMRPAVRDPPGEAARPGAEQGHARETGDQGEPGHVGDHVEAPQRLADERRRVGRRSARRTPTARRCCRSRRRRRARGRARGPRRTAARPCRHYNDSSGHERRARRRVAAADDPPAMPTQPRRSRLRHPGSIDWLEWSAEAFARAARERKPVLLSIGASWCHGCR